MSGPRSGPAGLLGIAVQGGRLSRFGVPMLVTLCMAALSPYSCPACLACMAVGVQAAHCCCLLLQTHAHGVAQPETACLLGTQRSSQFPSSTFRTRPGAPTPRAPAPQSPPSSPSSSARTLLSAAAAAAAAAAASAMEVRRLTWVGGSQVLGGRAPLFQACPDRSQRVGGVLSQLLCKMQGQAKARLPVEAANQLAVL